MLLMKGVVKIFNGDNHQSNVIISKRVKRVRGENKTKLIDLRVVGLNLTLIKGGRHFEP